MDDVESDWPARLGADSGNRRYSLPGVGEFCLGRADGGGRPGGEVGLLLALETLANRRVADWSGRRVVGLVEHPPGVAWVRSLALGVLALVVLLNGYGGLFGDY